MLATSDREDAPRLMLGVSAEADVADPRAVRLLGLVDDVEGGLGGHADASPVVASFTACS